MESPAKLTNPAPASKPRRARALWRLETAGLYLNLSRARVVERIEDCRLAWAFDFAAPKARRRELRVLSASVVESAGRPTGLVKPTANHSIEEVADLIMPHQRPELRETELQHCFGISHQALAQMHRRRALKATVRAKTTDGPKAPPQYSRASVIEFLRRSIYT